MNITQALGARATLNMHQLKVYIPSQDSKGNPVAQGEWSKKVGQFLAELAGGITITPAIGGWYNKETKETIWEKPLIINCHINEKDLDRGLERLRSLLHDMARELNQAEVAIEVDGDFYTIKEKTA